MGGRGGHIGRAKLSQAAKTLTIEGESIAKIVGPYIDQYKYVAIRTQEDKPFELGDLTYRSKVWVDGTETKRTLTGVSATSVKSNAVAAHSDIKTNYRELNKYTHGGYYIGNHIAVVVGNRAHRGTDIGEIVIEDPKVVKIIK